MFRFKAYAAAVFLARYEFMQARVAKPVSKFNLYSKLTIKNDTSLKEDEYTDYLKCRGASYRYERIRRAWIADYLEIHYPETDYATRFLENNKYNLPLPYPTDKSEQCPHRKEERHCDLERKSGCMTCCSWCWTPRRCPHSNCTLF